MNNSVQVERVMNMACIKHPTAPQVITADDGRICLSCWSSVQVMLDMETAQRALRELAGVAQ